MSASPFNSPVNCGADSDEALPRERCPSVGASVDTSELSRCETTHARFTLVLREQPPPAAVGTSERDATPVGTWDDAHPLVLDMDAEVQDAGTGSLHPVARRDTPSVDLTRRRAAPRESVVHIANVPKALERHIGLSDRRRSHLLLGRWSVPRLA